MTQETKPELPLTVSRELWDAMADAVRPTFADSYLSGAIEIGSRLTARNVTTYMRLTREEAAMACLRNRGITLIKPLPFGHPDRPDS